MESDTIRNVLGLAFVFGLLGVLVWRSHSAGTKSGIFPARSWTERWLATPPRRTPPVRQLAKLRLSPHHSLHLVEVNGQSLLLGCSASGITLVRPPDPADSSIEAELRRPE
jgi:hypothetical protein